MGDGYDGDTSSTYFDSGGGATGDGSGGSDTTTGLMDSPNPASTAVDQTAYGDNPSLDQVSNDVTTQTAMASILTQQWGVDLSNVDWNDPDTQAAFKDAMDSLGIDTSKIDFTDPAIQDQLTAAVAPSDVTSPLPMVNDPNDPQTLNGAQGKPSSGQSSSGGGIPSLGSSGGGAGKPAPQQPGSQQPGILTSLLNALLGKAKAPVTTTGVAHPQKVNPAATGNPSVISSKPTTQSGWIIVGLAVVAVLLIAFLISRAGKEGQGE